jgi:hypothetical protein
MYGLIIEAIVECIKIRYGNHMWEQVQKNSKLDEDFFSTHQQYSEAILQKIMRALSSVTSRLFSNDNLD